MTFTEREQRILALILANKTNREIAAEFHVDVTRIDQLIRRIKRKAGVRTKGALKAWA